MEEMVAANCWPLGRNRPTMTIEMSTFLFLAKESGFSSLSSVFNLRKAMLLRRL